MRSTRSRVRLTTRRPTRREGFTLLEVIVAVSIIAILASIIVPRFAGGSRRQFDLAVDQVGDLLVMFAQRDNLGRQPIGLMHDDDTQVLKLMVLDTIDEDSTGPAEWRPDLFVQPLVLPPILDHEAIWVYADGEQVDIREWPLAHMPGEERPMIEIVLRSRDEEHQATLLLPAHGVAPVRTDKVAYAARQPVDLDAQGRSREDW